MQSRNTLDTGTQSTKPLKPQGVSALRQTNLQAPARVGGLRVQPSPFNQRVSDDSTAWAVPAR